jgi:hypothetical protein
MKIKSNILKISIFATGLSGIVAQYILSTLASYFLGDSTVQWALTVSVMLFAMGLGARVSKYLDKMLLSKFIFIEYILSLFVSFASLFVYLLASRIKTLFKLKKDFSLEKELKPFDVLKDNSNIRFSNAKEIYNVGKEDFVYVSRSKTGKSIYNLSTEKGKSINKEIINLGLNPKRRSSFSYIGSFGVNAKKRRMVYAYKYFKIVKFFDMDTHEIKTINFERETFKENSVYKVNGLDANVTHYWKISTSDKYVYLLYSGRTPVQVGREMMKHKCYIYVEKYDWNGNPISKYKLDRWGYFFADPNDNKIILCSADEDEPFFEYILP